MADNKYDIQLPEAIVEPLDLLAFSQTEDWGFKLIDPKPFYKLSKGEKSCIFILDTEDNFTHPDLEPNNLTQYNRTFTGSPTKEPHGHGIHCAGIANAANNAFGIIGVAPAAKNVAVKVLNDSGAGSWHWVAGAIRYVADLEIDYRKVISLSLGGSGGSPILYDAIKYALGKRCFICAAAGNRGCDQFENSIDFPGRYEEVITFGSIGKTKKPSRFSSCGPEIDLCAPGEDIYSTHVGGGYAKLNGTSMATPFGAGVVALIASAFPNIENQSQMMDYLKLHATDLLIPGFDNLTGHGVPIISKYVEDPEPEPDPDPVPDKKFPYWIIPVGIAVIILIYFILKNM